MSLSHRGFCLAFDVCSQWSEGIEQLPLFSPLSMLRKAKMFSSVDAELQKLNYRNLILNTFYSSPKTCMHGGINGTLPEVMAEYFWYKYGLSLYLSVHLEGVDFVMLNPRGFLPGHILITLINKSVFPYIKHFCLGSWRIPMSASVNLGLEFICFQFKFFCCRKRHRCFENSFLLKCPAWQWLTQPLGKLTC